MLKTRGGQYLARLGRSLFEIAPHADPVDVVLCRRVADYPNQREPLMAIVGMCTGCGAPIAFNPCGPHLEVPKICLQCGGIEPLPIEDPS